MDPAPAKIWHFHFDPKRFVLFFVCFVLILSVLLVYDIEMKIHNKKQ